MPVDCGIQAVTLSWAKYWCGAGDGRLLPSAPSDRWADSDAATEAIVAPLVRKGLCATWTSAAAGFQPDRPSLVSGTGVHVGVAGVLGVW
jgi:hypothetical protein